MAVTSSTVVKRMLWGSQRAHLVDVVMGTSYPTGGEPLTAAQLGLKSVVHVDASQKTVGTTLRAFQYDATNSKMLAFQGKDPANAGGADIPFPEVANTTNLSAVTVRVLAVGN